MEFKQKKGIILVAAIVIGASAIGGLFYYSQRADAREAAEKQVLMENIRQQQELEEAAQKVKADAPVVDESHPARYLAPTDQTPDTEITQSSSTSSTQANSSSNTVTPAAVQKIPTQTPVTTTTPPAQPAPKVQQDPVAAITALSDADIQRLQSYPTYGSTGQGFFESFSDFYANPHNQVQDLPSRFSPASLSVYNKAKVGWLTSPRLIYGTAIGQIAYRGILTLTYYGDNSFGLTPNVTYQREVEYRLENSVETGFAFSSVKYLSDFRAVK